MSLEVNLASQQVKKEPISRRTLISILFATLSAATFGGVFFYNMLLNGQITSIARENSQLERNIQVALTGQSDYALLSSKLKGIESILSSRTPIDSRLNQVLTILPSGVIVTQLDASQDTLRLSLSSADLSALNAFLDEGIDRLSQDDPTISKIDMVSFSRNENTAEYVASILLTYSIKDNE